MGFLLPVGNGLTCPLLAWKRPLHIGLSVSPEATSSQPLTWQKPVHQLPPSARAPDPVSAPGGGQGVRTHLHEQLLLCEAVWEGIREVWAAQNQVCGLRSGRVHHGLDPSPPRAPLSLHR